jgi:hypothetical protein
MRSKNILASMTAILFLLLPLVSAMAATVPAGTAIPVRMNTELSSETAQVGQTFEGTLAEPVKIGGTTLARGTVVRGKVTDAKSSGRLKAPGELSLRLTSVGGHTVNTSTFAMKGKSHTKSNATKIGGGAAAGALIGGLAGGGKGAAIGAGVGAGAGTGVAAATGKEPAVVKPEEVITFTTR